MSVGNSIFPAPLNFILDAIQSVLWTWRNSIFPRLLVHVVVSVATFFAYDWWQQQLIITFGTRFLSFHEFSLFFFVGIQFANSTFSFFSLCFLFFILLCINNPLFSFFLAVTTNDTCANHNNALFFFQNHRIQLHSWSD